jgi:excisionase family DNA binding protein
MSKLLTVKDIAKMLNVSNSFVYNLISSKQINFYKIGNSVRIREESFNKYLEENKVNIIR